MKPPLLHRTYRELAEVIGAPLDGAPGNDGIASDVLDVLSRAIGAAFLAGQGSAVRELAEAGALAPAPVPADTAAAVAAMIEAVGLVRELDPGEELATRIPTPLPIPSRAPPIGPVPPSLAPGLGADVEELDGGPRPVRCSSTLPGVPRVRCSLVADHGGLHEAALHSRRVEW